MEDNFLDDTKSRDFWGRFIKNEYFIILAALPGAERREGVQP